MIWWHFQSQISVSVDPSFKKNTISLCKLTVISCSNKTNFDGVIICTECLCVRTSDKEEKLPSSEMKNIATLHLGVPSGRPIALQHVDTFFFNGRPPVENLFTLFVLYLPYPLNAETVVQIIKYRISLPGFWVLLPMINISSRWAV